MNRTFQGLFLVFVAATTSAPSVVAAESLYDRMGGAPVVARVIDELIQRNRVDPRTKRSFQKINVKRTQEMLNEQFCAIAGGPCKYMGDDMKVVHAGLDITDAEFNGLVENLIAALDANGVGLREKNELLKLLAPMKRDIVTK
ncbi:MAG TPA: group 1 truncated hemoglobin [Burkholderiales bacterium]|nr:group 1 truncated hemoglobin [Burkholderiales bacterium]